MIRRVDERIVGQRVKQFLFRSSPQTRLSFGNCFVCPETPQAERHKTWFLQNGRKVTKILQNGFTVC
jgi:hypothetical protein